ncbi:hypothetical protein [Oceanobacillus sojae]|uniref:Uncharacterized protein n=1 Tax=Oceanobacillus sojae TaxID=582851 RepID=A0A511ZII8_9BACI|nr:hypothetical protein [Oceanobacillus sojae]GEN87262.1 hypothetical protein OSO01_20010 [Oceanobacillus sojae]
MIVHSSYTPETKETTVVQILTKEDEPCGVKTDYKYDYKPQAE